MEAVSDLHAPDVLTRLFSAAFLAWLIGPALLPLLVGLAQRRALRGLVTCILAAGVSLLVVPVASLLDGVVPEEFGRLLVPMPVVIAVVATMIMERERGWRRR
jgi:peptidoglycan/LPS O-acetylase OafA/YrhL